MTDKPLKAVDLKIDEDAHIAWITFNRPEVRNALTLDMYRQVAEHIWSVEDNDEIKVVVLRGAGESFSTGQDLNEVGHMYGFDDGEGGPTKRPMQRRRLAVDRKWGRYLSAVSSCGKVTIASVQGHCLGAAFDMFLGCDLSVVAEDAQLGHPGRRLVGPAMGFNTQLWYWRLGAGVARYMTLTGDTISGTQAGAWGIAPMVVPADDLEKATLKLAERVARVPGDGLAIGKGAMRLAEEVGGSVSAGYSYGYLMHSFGTNIRFSPDEHNFFKRRREVGTSAAFRERDANFEG